MEPNIRYNRTYRRPSCKGTLHSLLPRYEALARPRSWDSVSILALHFPARSTADIYQQDSATTQR